MAEVKKATPYEEALDALSSLITKRSRADKSNKGDRFDLLFDYIKILDLEEAISQMKVIHVAGTKGKGSTCTFTESILRNCGFVLGFSLLLTSLMFEKDFVWMGLTYVKKNLWHTFGGVMIGSRQKLLRIYQCLLTFVSLPYWPSRYLLESRCCYLGGWIGWKI